MAIRPIRNDDDLTEALRRLDALWGAAPGTPEGDELDILAVLIEDYETRHFPIVPLEPIDFLKAHMEATGRTQSDLAGLLGSAPRASEVLNKRRALTVDMIHKLAIEWNIPADCLVKPYPLAA
jgi:HTH-type transcriptional regulator / antitoxin HigA